MKKLKLKNIIRFSISIIIILLGLMSGESLGQEKLSINISVDGKLIFLGDDMGNGNLTPNTLVRVEMQGDQQNYGFLYISPEYEYADLSGGVYHRYSANVGYTFNKLPFKRVEVGGSVGYGAIIRNKGKISQSFGGQLDLIYRITDRLRFVTTFQIVDRTDIQTIRGSVFYGLKFYFHNTSNISW